MSALESASVKQDIRPFAALVGDLVEACLRGPAAPGGAVRAFVAHLWRHHHSQTGIRLLGMMMIVVIIIMLTFMVDRARSSTR